MGSYACVSENEHGQQPLLGHDEPLLPHLSKLQLQLW